MKNAFIQTAIVVLGFFALTSLSLAQDFQLSEEHRAAMKKLEFFVGSWEGEAWAIMPNQPKETLIQTEVVRWDLDESILVVKGLGKRIDPETKKETVVHQALGIMSYDPQEAQYRMNSYLADGRSTVAEAYLESPGEFIWTIKAANGLTIRYTVKLNDAGQWTEVGEWSRDGENWQQFFGMTLNRVK